MKKIIVYCYVLCLGENKTLNTIKQKNKTKTMLFSTTSGQKSTKHNCETPFCVVSCGALWSKKAALEQTALMSADCQLVRAFWACMGVCIRQVYRLQVCTGLKLN